MSTVRCLRFLIPANLRGYWKICTEAATEELFRKNNVVSEVKEKNTFIETQRNKKKSEEAQEEFEKNQKEEKQERRWEVESRRTEVNKRKREGEN